MAAQMASAQTRGGLGSLAGYGTGGIGAASPPEEIKTLQRALNYYASAGLAVDGRFGPRTFEALDTWQRRTGGWIPTGYHASDNMLAGLGLQPGGRFASEAGGGSYRASGGGGGGTQTGGGGSQPPTTQTGDRVRFEWQAPASLALTSVVWGNAQDAFGRAMVGAGFTVEYNSYVTQLHLGGLWALHVRGISPAGLTDKDSINNQLINLANASGFDVTVGSETLTLGSRVASGAPNADDKDEPFDLMKLLKDPLPFLGGVTLGAALAGLAVVAVVLKDD